MNNNDERLNNPLEQKNSINYQDQMEDLITKNSDKDNLELKDMLDVHLDISVVLGNTTLSLGNLLKITKGSIIELDKLIGESVEIYANNKIIGRGEIIIVEHSKKIGVTLTEVVINNKDLA